MTDDNIILLRNGERLEIDAGSEVITAEVDADGGLIINAWAFSKASAIEIAEELLEAIKEMDDGEFKPVGPH